MAGTQFRPALVQLRAYPPDTYQPGHLRLWRWRALCHLLLCGAAHQPRAPDLGRSRELRVLGLAAAGGGHDPELRQRADHEQGIRRDDLAAGDSADARLADRSEERRVGKEG